MISSASSSASPSGVSVSCEPVMTSVGAVIVRSSNAQLVGRRRGSRRPARRTRAGFVCTSTRGEHVDEHAEAALQARPDQPAHAVVASARPCRARSTTSAHSASSSRRHAWCWHAVHASDERPHPIGVHHADDLRDHAAHRRAHDVRALDALGVEHRERVRGHLEEVVRAGRRVGVTGAAVVGRDAAVPAAERAPLERPTRGVDRRGPGSSGPACRRDGPTRRTRCVPSSVTVADMTRALTGVGVSAGGRADAADRRRRIASAKRAAASGSSGSYGIRQASPAARSVTAHEPIATERPPGVHRGGNDRRERERVQRRARGGSPAPRAQPGGRERDADEMTGAQSATRTSGPLLGSRRGGARQRRRTARRARRRRAGGDRSRVAPRCRARPARRCRSRGSTTITAGPVAARARRPSTRTRTAAVEHGTHEIGELRVEPERIDRVPTRRGGGAAPVNERLGPRDPVGVERRRSVATVTRPALRAAAIGDDVGPLEELAQHVLGRHEVGEAERVARAARRRRCSRDGAARSTCGASAAPASSDARADRAPQARRNRATGRDRRAAPPATASRRRADDVERAVEPALDRGDHRLGRVVGVQQRERRIGDRATGTTGSRSSRPSGLGTCDPTHRRVAQRADRHAVAQRDARADRLDLEQRAPVRRRGSGTRLRRAPRRDAVGGP